MVTERDTLTVVRGFLQQLANGDLDALGELFAENIDWRLSWPEHGHSAVPWIRPRSTRADAIEHFHALRNYHVPEQDASEVHQILVDGTDAVVLATIVQTVRATGEAYNAHCALHLTVESGLITRFHVYEDSLSVANAFTAAGSH